MRSPASCARAAAIGIADVVAEDRLSVEERAQRGSYVGCIGGALSRSEFADCLEHAGFVEVEVRFTNGVADGMYSAAIRATRAAD